MRAPVLTVALAALLGTGLTSCTVATAPVLELGAARERWASRGPTDYRVTISRACECLPSMSGPVVVTVRGGTVTARHYVATGAAVGPDFAELFPSVPGLFEYIDDARRRGAARVDVKYDPVLGYPVDIAVDYDATMVDDEVSYSVRDLQPL